MQRPSGEGEANAFSIEARQNLKIDLRLCGKYVFALDNVVCFSLFFHFFPFFTFFFNTQSSFESIPKWVEEANRFCTERNYVGYVVGTKSDIVDQEEGDKEEDSEEEPGRTARVDVEKKGSRVPVDEKDAKYFAKTVGMPYMRVTATDFTALKLFNSMMDDVWIRFIDPNAKKTSKKEGSCCIAM